MSRGVSDQVIVLRERLKSLDTPRRQTDVLSPSNPPKLAQTSPNRIINHAPHDSRRVVVWRDLGEVHDLGAEVGAEDGAEGVLFLVARIVGLGRDTLEERKNTIGDGRKR